MPSALRPPRPVYPVAAIRAIEAIAIPGAEPPLMERAGAAAAALALPGLGPLPAAVLVACGPGNNGGDGFVLARHLRAAGHPVRVAFASSPERLPTDARGAHDAWLACGGETLSELPAPPDEGWALVVDALFGIGLQRPLDGRYADWIATLNAQDCPRLALDIPSGLDADTGRSLGACFAATHTLTFIALKPGLLTLDGPDHCGQIEVASLDLDAEAIAPAPGREVGTALFARELRPRLRNTHKGSFGDVAIIGGAPGMVGAALLAARAAAHLGAGRVLVGLLDAAALAVDPLRPELMFRSAEALLTEEATAYAVGPGLGLTDGGLALVEAALSLKRPLVLDADALNIIARYPDLQRTLAARTDPAILTPHPAEAARLLGTSTAAVQADRIAACREIAARLRAHVVLKGSGSIVSNPAGQWWINTTGNPAMATAGMGDVLTGLIVALLAQAWPAQEALLAGVHLHGLGADTRCRELDIRCGLLADEVGPAARQCFNRWLDKPAAPNASR